MTLNKVDGILLLLAVLASFAMGAVANYRLDKAEKRLEMLEGK